MAVSISTNSAFSSSLISLISVYLWLKSLGTATAYPESLTPTIAYTVSSYYHELLFPTLLSLVFTIYLQTTFSSLPFSFFSFSIDEIDRWFPRYCICLIIFFNILTISLKIFEYIIISLILLSNYI